MQVKRRKGWRMSCDAGEVTEMLENEQSSQLQSQQSSFSNLSITSPTSQLILQPFRRFTYITTHSPTLLLLHLRHSSFSNRSFASLTSQVLHLIHLASQQSSFSNLSVTSPRSQLILQAFRRFTYVTAHSPTLPLLYLRHSSFSNPSFASPTSQSLRLIHLANRPCSICYFNKIRQFTFMKDSAFKSISLINVPFIKKAFNSIIKFNGKYCALFYYTVNKSRYLPHDFTDMLHFTLLCFNELKKPQFLPRPSVSCAYILIASCRYHPSNNIMAFKTVLSFLTAKLHMGCWLPQLKTINFRLIIILLTIIGFSRGLSRFSLPQISFHHFFTLISSISFHFISLCDGATSAVGRHPCYSLTYNIGASSHLIPRPDLVLDTS